MDEVIVGLDCSTTSATAIAWDADWCVRAQGKAPLDTQTPHRGFAEQCPEAWWSSSVEALRQCTDALADERVVAVGITFQRETFALVDECGNAVRPAILWHDGRAVTELGELRRALDPVEVHRTTGKQLDITSAAAKILWCRRHEPGLFARARSFADVPAFLTSRFFGTPTTVACGVDTTGLTDLHGRWWLEPLRVVQADSLGMPVLTGARTIAGLVEPGPARECGLPAGVPVVVAGGDGHCSTHAALALAGQPRAASLTLGTSAVLGLQVDTPIIDSAFRTLIACTPDRFVLESVVQCGSATLTWFDDVFSESERRAADWDRLCADVPAGSGGLLVVPHWRGVRVPHNDPLARGIVLGWNDQVTEAAFRRAIMEGMALEFRQLIDQIAAGRAHAPDGLVVGGGGASADVWCQILADTMALPVVRPFTVELSSLGAALCAWEATGRPSFAPGPLGLETTTFEPDAERTRLYEYLLQAYSQVYPATRGIAQAMARAAPGAETR